jgi:hypothetical protein
MRREEMLKTYALCLKGKFVVERAKSKLNSVIGIAMESAMY